MATSYTSVAIKGSVGLPGASIEYQVQGETADQVMDQLVQLTERVEAKFRQNMGLWNVELKAADAARVVGEI